MFLHQRVKVLRLAHIVVDPFPDLVCSVTLEADPHFKSAKTSRLLEAVNVVLVALVRTIGLVGKICGLKTERRGQSTVILNQDRTRIQRRVEPLVGINRDESASSNPWSPMGHAWKSNMPPP